MPLYGMKNYNYIIEPFFLLLFPPGFPQTFQTTAELTKYITMVIFASSALHSAVNFSQVSSPEMKHFSPDVDTSFLFILSVLRPVVKLTGSLFFSNSIKFLLKLLHLYSD